MKTWLLMVVIGMGLVASGCGGMFKGKKAAEKSIADFHKMYNEGQVTNIYATSHAKLRNATKEKEFLDFLGAMQRKLGSVKRTTNNGFNVRSMNFVTTVVLTQNTTFEQGSGTETFTFEMDGDKAVLVGYHINSKELILK